MKKSKKFLAVLALAATCGVAATGCSLTDANSKEMTRLLDDATGRVTTLLDEKLSKIEDQQARILLANAATNSSLQSKVQMEVTSKIFSDSSFDEIVESTLNQIKIVNADGSAKAYVKGKIFQEGRSDNDEIEVTPNEGTNKISGNYMDINLYNVCLDKCYTFDEVHKEYYEDVYIGLELGAIAFDFLDIYNKEIEISGVKKDNITTIYMSNLSKNKFYTITIENNLFTSMELVYKSEGYNSNNNYSKYVYKYNENVETPNFPTSTSGYRKVNTKTEEIIEEIN